MDFSLSTRFCGLLLGLGAWTATVAAQKPAALAAAKATAAPKRQLRALRISTPPKLDGLLDEAEWQAAPLAGQFIELEPTPGRPEKHPTEVRVLYDDAAIYVGAVMHDVAQDSIFRELTARDNIGNSDFFGVMIDPYHDQLNGYQFLVTSGGVQVDARISPASGEDANWNAVWDSRTARRGTDWVAEIRIPFSAIRFSNQPEQLWGLNFMRQRRSTRQKFFWNEVRRQVDGFVNQWGELTGVAGVKPPLRLSLTPYLASYVNHNPLSVPGTPRTTASLNGGADLKWGINESFTLDATLVPDFGQVQSDNQVLNLSPFEVQFNENRQFFTEGTELFNKGNLFYSRRVGATPIGYYGVAAGPGERVLRNPSETPLLNATKVSGRTSKGLGIGVFNAVSSEVHATLRNDETGQERQVQTQPLSNYSIAVLDQSLKHNSYVSLINTNVTRAGRTYDANVTGGLLRLANQKNSYALDGRLFYSRRRGAAFGTSREINDRDGYKYLLGLAKISGNFVWNLSHGVESDTYNPNDLGILFGNNSITQTLDLGYSKYQPFWKVNNLFVFGNISHALLYKPTRYQALYVYLGANTTFTKRFLQVGFDLNVDPAAHDFFEPRTAPLGDYYVRVPANARLSLFLNTDSRKKLALSLDAGGQRHAPDDRLARTRRGGYNLGLNPRYRVNDHLTFRYGLEWSRRANEIGYVNGGLDTQEPLDQPFLNQILLGRRTVTTVANVVSAAYTFTNRMSFTLRVRQYSSNVRYADFARLARGGDEQPVAYQRNRDNTYNAFNVDAVYAWWFAPGSQVSVVWKNAGSTFPQANEATPQFFDNFNNTLNAPHNNSVSVKVLYYLDYLALRKGK